MESPKEFVLDGSVTMAWYFKDEMNDYANAAGKVAVTPFPRRGRRLR